MNRFAVSKSNEREASVASCTSMPTESCAENLNVYVALQFCHFTREGDVRFYTGLPSTEHFRVLYVCLNTKADKMTYWRGPRRLSGEVTHVDLGRRGPQRTLSLEQELLMSLMK